MDTMELPKSVKATKTEANRHTFGVSVTSDDGPNIEVTCNQLRNMLYAWFIAFSDADCKQVVKLPDGTEIEAHDSSVITKAVDAALASACGTLSVRSAPRAAILGDM